MNDVKKNIYLLSLIIKQYFFFLLTCYGEFHLLLYIHGLSVNSGPSIGNPSDLVNSNHVK